MDIALEAIAREEYQLAIYNKYTQSIMDIERPGHLESSIQSSSQTTERLVLLGVIIRRKYLQPVQ